MKSPAYTCRYCSRNTYSAITTWLILVVCFTYLETKAQSVDQSQDVLTVSELFSNTQQSNFSGNNEAILTTDVDRPYYSPIFIGVPPDQIQPCGAALPSWPVVIAKLQDYELLVTPYERIDFTSCGGKTITRIWSVTNPDGNKSSRQQLITFSDAEPPLLAIAGDTMVGTGQEVPQPYYEASDHGCSSFTMQITEEKVALNESEYSIIRRYEATDGCGNSTTRTQQIQVSKSEGREKQTKEKSVSSLEFRK